MRIDVQQSPRNDNVTLTHNSEPSQPRSSKRRKAASKKRDNDIAKQHSLEIQLFQDTTGLRSRKGDTGNYSTFAVEPP